MFEAKAEAAARTQARLGGLCWLDISDFDDFQIFGEQGMAFLYEIFCVWFLTPLKVPMIDSSISSNILINGSPGSCFV